MYKKETELPYSNLITILYVLHKKGTWTILKLMKMTNGKTSDSFKISHFGCHRSVSYTHLDVYKRQAILLMIIYPFYIIFVTIHARHSQHEVKRTFAIRFRYLLFKPWIFSSHYDIIVDIRFGYQNAQILITRIAPCFARPQSFPLFDIKMLRSKDTIRIAEGDFTLWKSNVNF